MSSNKKQVRGTSFQEYLASVNAPVVKTNNPEKPMSFKEYLERVRMDALEIEGIAIPTLDTEAFTREALHPLFQYLVTPDELLEQVGRMTPGDVEEVHRAVTSALTQETTPEEFTSALTQGTMIKSVLNFTLAQSFLKSAAESAIEKSDTFSAVRTVPPFNEMLRWLKESFKLIGNVPPAERKSFGLLLNAAQRSIGDAHQEQSHLVSSILLRDQLDEDAVDVTLPGRQASVGAAHPISQMIDELVEIFAHLGFQSVFGPEVETGRYNFDLLNIPSDHPARDVWDTMIVQAPNAEIVMRTHTSPMQARTMERIDPPVRVIVPGKAYRFEDQDASHEWQFTQLEGLMVDKNVRLSDLKGVLEEMARQLFGPERKVRFRCDFFPFVEPGVDFSVDCAVCDGKGCRVCKYTGWLEMGGAGMVHPSVLRGVGYDPQVYSGFAFGLGIERIIMMKYGVDDIRAFQANDLRFLRRFAETTV